MCAHVASLADIDVVAYALEQWNIVYDFVRIFSIVWGPCRCVIVSVKSNAHWMRERERENNLLIAHLTD